MKAIFLRAIEETEDKDRALRLAINDRGIVMEQTRFEVDPEDFRRVPRSPFSYWVGTAVLASFRAHRALESDGRVARITNPVGDNFRFLRTAWEMPASDHGASPSQRSWLPFSKGGRHQAFYADTHLVADWEPSVCSFRGFLGTTHRPLVKPASLAFFFRPGLTWPARSQSGLSLRVMPAGCIFGGKGPAAFVPKDDPNELLTLLAIMNSLAFRALVDIQMAFGSYEVGVLQRTPVPATSTRDQTHLAALARRSWSLLRLLDTSTEHSHAFVLPALLQTEGNLLADAAQYWVARIAEAESELHRLQTEIDDCCFELYGLDGADRKEIERRLGGVATGREVGERETEEEDAETPKAEARSLVASLISWTVGVAFGRFDLRLVTGERLAPDEPEPFDPLPVCSPGMLTGGDGLPLDAPPAGYAIDIPRDGILVDDAGAGRDLVATARRIFNPIFDDPATRWEEAAEILGDRGLALRAWVAREFFELHIKRYSKSRRKAPIYWQLATPSTSYSAWLYYHRFTRDTLFCLLNDQIAPKLQHEERKLTSLTQEAGPNPAASQRKAIDAQASFFAELRAFRDEVARVAPLWNPNLNDGVLLNFAPLWRLVPQHRSWQNQCKKAWNKLCKGDYDWAHLAMHLWPERVVPKCIDDRSLAIAHDLEEVFWRENDNGKWSQREVAEATVRQLIAERTSPAVKAALQDLLSAPAPTGGKTRRRKSVRRRPKARPVSMPAQSSRTQTRSRASPKRSAPAVDQSTLNAVRDAIGTVAGGAAKSDVLAATGLSSGQWTTVINALLDEGRVVKTGAKRGTRYHLKD